MRLISMERDGGVRDSLKWSKKSRRNWNSYGIGDSASLPFYPTNLGTVIRASVHVRLPKLSADYQRFEEIGRARSSGENEDIIWIEFNHLIREMRECYNYSVDIEGQSRIVIFRNLIFLKVIFYIVNMFFSYWMFIEFYLKRIFIFMDFIIFIFHIYIN